MPARWILNLTREDNRKNVLVIWDEPANKGRAIIGNGKIAYDFGKQWKHIIFKVKTEGSCAFRWDYPRKKIRKVISKY